VTVDGVVGAGGAGAIVGETNGCWKEDRPFDGDGGSRSDELHATTHIRHPSHDIRFSIGSSEV
jgi:hypothetical protein